MFDEPSSYLDVKQRLSAARTIRSLLRSDGYIIVVEVSFDSLTAHIYLTSS